MAAGDEEIEEIKNSSLCTEQNKELKNTNHQLPLISSLYL